MLHPVLFIDERNRSAYAALAAASGDLHRASEEADPLVAEHLARLAVEDTDAEIGDVRRLLLRDRGLEVLRNLERDSRSAADIGPYVVAIGWLHGHIEAVGPNAPSGNPAEDELLDWLVQRVEDSDE